ncbi:MAG: ring-cleaving dioxygenase [Gemmatimonadales bacterium]|jgi:glyoxalase family protein
MEQQLTGIHHVTAITGDPQRTLDFYSEVLGLRLVKRTVNFDDPGTYHFYFGNERGEPGTLLTFFPWLGARRGRIGTGQVTATALSIPETAIAYWTARLAALGVDVRDPEDRFEETFIAINDPDGLAIELVGRPDDDDRAPWPSSPVEPRYAIRGCDSVTVSGRRCEPMQELLDELGFRLVGESGDRLRYVIGDGRSGTRLDLLCESDPTPGLVAVGTVHHVAWRTPDAEGQAAWRRRLATLGLDVTRILDRGYFRSIYFREPGGVLFEIATDGPGFLIDETADELGLHLKLPGWLEPRRSEVERVLPEIELARARKG